SADAISLYCLEHGLGPQLSQIVGRDQNAALMKPDPHLVKVAVTRLGAKPDECTFVGDSVTDVTAGRLAGVAVIGYANKPGKAAQLAGSGADAVTDSLDHIREVIVDSSG